MSSYYISSLPSMLQYPHSHFYIFKRKLNKNGRQTPFPSLSIAASSSSSNDNQTSTSSKSPKLVTFLGKGGAGKTTSAVFAAQHYAMSGLRTCLVVQSQDPSPEYLLNCKIGTSPIKCSDNLSAVRLETTKMILEPLDQLKKADARLNMTQGVLEAVVGEELGVLPAMDSIFAVLFLGRLMGMLQKDTSRNNSKDDFDIIVYDGVSTHETLRMIGAASKAKLYLKYVKNLAEKTDLGRLVSPSLLRLADEGINLSSSKRNLNGSMSAEIWERLEKILERGSSSFSDPHKFGCFLVMDLNSPASVNYALRHWGCTIQAGAQVSGAIGISSPSLNEASVEEVKGRFLPLPFAFIPHLATSSPVDWSSIMQNSVGQGSKALFSLPTGHTGGMSSPVTFDVANKSVTLFMPGFDKSEIKLYQFRGGSELLVEAGDQRRVIYLPLKIQGKVGGAKFVDRSLIITMR